MSAEKSDSVKCRCGHDADYHGTDGDCSIAGCDCARLLEVLS